MEQWNEIKEKIYPWVKQTLYDTDLIPTKNIKVKETPLISFVGDLMIVLVISRGEKYEVLKEKMVPEEITAEELYHLACENLVRDVKFVVSRTMYGGYGIIADGHHEVSSLCYQHIWNICAEKLEDDLVIAAPSKDMVLFLPAGADDLMDAMEDFSNQAYDRGENKVTRQWFYFDRKKKELSVYEKAV